MTDNNFLTAEELLRKARKDVVLSTGAKVQIRRISPSEFVQAARHLPSLLAFGQDITDMRKGEKSLADVFAGPQGEEALKGIERVVHFGLVSPRLGLDPAAGPAVSDLPLTEQMEIFNEILALAGFSKEAAQEVAPL